MKAVRWHSRGDVRLDDVEAPTKPQPGFVVVDVDYCGICGTDVAEFRDGPKLIHEGVHPLTGQAPPVTLGHEFVGRIAETAEGDFAVGDRVTADACWRCGTCSACISGAYHRCRYGGSIGLHSDGAFAQRVLVPEYCLVRVPDSVGDLEAALAEPLAVALHALDRAAVRAGDVVVVLGFGPIGASVALAGLALGAAMHVVEIDESRRAQAEAFGFPTIDAGEGLPRRIRAEVGGGGADVAVESTGVASVLADSIECVRRGGRVALAGITSAPANLDTSRLVLFERSLIGSLGYQGDVERAVELMANGLVRPGLLVSDTISLDETPEMIAGLAAATSGRIKVVVRVGA